MFDVAPTEFMLVALVALLVIGPKELPKLMRVIGHWVGKARGVARQFRSGFDEMMRESELAEMEKKWREENDRIMREFPAADPPPALDAPASPEGSTPKP
jgi:sec-independent protein translocase protein TatB